MLYKMFRSFFVLILVIGLVGIQAPQRAHAAGPWFVSTTGADGNDCLTPTTPCATINGAIGKASSGDTVNVAEGTYTGSGSEVVLLNRNITLSGGWDETFTTQNGMTIVDGENIRRGFTTMGLPSAPMTTIDRFFIQNGSAADGGGILVNNDDHLTLNNSFVRGNTTENQGAGILNAGSLTIHGSTIDANTASAPNGRGAGIWNDGTLVLSMSTVDGNTAGWHSGGIYNSGMATITQSTISANSASTAGGIWNDGGFGSSVGILNISNATISTNTSTGNGGGIVTSSGGVTNINNASIAENSATGDGGGIFNVAAVNLQNTLIAGNTAGGTGQECGGSVTSLGYNFVEGSTDCIFSPGDGDIGGVGSALGPLQDNGGPTFTYALQPDSPAIDAGNPVGCTDQDGEPLATDQRGITRPQGSRCDIGAFELEGGGGPIPANDNYANAQAILSPPFSALLNVNAATLETDEPQTCLPTDRSVWYTFIPPEAMNLLAATFGSSNTKISIYRSTGPGIEDLEFVQCASGGGGITFLAESGATYYLQVGALVGEVGIIQFSLSQFTGISGRVTDSATGAPLPGDTPPFTFVSLYIVCGEGCLELVTSGPTNADGTFRFDSYLGSPVQPGTYSIEVSASGYQTRQFGPFEFSGANLDVGDLPMDLPPAIGSIRGRLLDNATGKPVPETFWPSVQLYRCTDGSCFEFVNGQLPDADGRFRFETDNLGNPLPAGTYQVVASADQYHGAQTQLFEVGEGQQRNVGTVRIRSFPVRFSDVVACDTIPASGECLYSVRIWNGLGAKLEGQAWSLASSAVPNSLIGFTDFQVKQPQELELERGKSRVFRFRFKFPASDGAALTEVCTRVFVGRGGNPFFNTIGFWGLFCAVRTADGLSIASAQNALEPVQRSADVAATAAEVEPNNSCHEAQDVGTVPLPFTMDGNLDGSAAPDIDFYRFSGTAGEPIIIEHEGQSTGKGTLPDPLLGVFDSNCNLYTFNDDSDSLNSRVTMFIPADGVFTLAATAYPDFNFVGGGDGTYQLTITPLIPIGSINGRVTNESTGAPIPGDAIPFAFIYLQRCDEFGCFIVSSQPAGSDGSFRFELDSNGIPLGVGTYMVTAVAEQHNVRQTELFEVGEGEHLDLGTLSLTGFPIQFSDVQGCDIPSQGGVCEISVKATNTLPTRVTGKAWSLVHALSIGSFLDFTSFQTDTPLNVRLDPGASRTLRFRFRVRSAVPDGALICSEAFIGQNPDTYFAPVGRGLLFCLVKGAGGLTLMTPQDAQAAMHQLKMDEMGPAQWFADKKK